MSDQAKSLAGLFENNKKWAENIKEKHPSFFEELSAQQNPDYLWIGCADSRVPSNQIIDLPPGEVFVHRNIANVVNHSDLNFLSVLQYAVDVLEVKHIIVCGHYGCGGVNAALGNNYNGLVDNWVRPIKDVYFVRKADVDGFETEEERLNKLCEVNVEAQVYNMANTSVVQQAWKRGVKLSVHGVIYGLQDGLLKDLDVSISSPDQCSPIYRYSD